MGSESPELTLAAVRTARAVGDAAAPCVLGIAGTGLTVSWGSWDPDSWECHARARSLRLQVPGIKGSRWSGAHW